MSYNYQLERSKIFTEEGQVTFMKIRDKIKEAFKSTGAITVDHAISGIGGGCDSWTLLACIDRLEELGEIEILKCQHVFSQYNVIVEKSK